MAKAKFTRTHGGLDGETHPGLRRGCARCSRAYMRIWRGERLVIKAGDPVRIKAIGDDLREHVVVGRLIGPVFP